MEKYSMTEEYLMKMKVLNYEAAKISAKILGKDITIYEDLIYGFNTAIDLILTHCEVEVDDNSDNRKN